FCCATGRLQRKSNLPAKVVPSSKVTVVQPGPEVKDEFLKEIYSIWFVINKEDKRTRGLRKVELQGTTMCCLAAKICIGIREEET
uniref:Uncharacterized protein n=1 Tax=Romanomermis culicivorax TaxID=13658 RepID=A0A915HVL9_ROMCU